MGLRRPKSPFVDAMHCYAAKPDNCCGGTFTRMVNSVTGCTENRLDHDLRRHLHHSVPHCRYPQRPLLPICFRYVSSFHREWTISAFSQCRFDFRQKLPDAPLFDGLDGFGIHPCRTAVAALSPPRFPQDVTPIDPVIQRMEAPCLTLLGTHI